MILEWYSQHLQLNAKRDAFSRSPLEFIGCIKRAILTPKRCERSRGRKHQFFWKSRRPKQKKRMTTPAQVLTHLQTLDEICIYSLCAVPLGYAHPPLRTVQLKTMWDVKDGVPVSSKSMPQTDESLEAMVPIGFPLYYLHSSPEFSTSCGFQYESDCKPKFMLGYATSEAECTLKSFCQLGLKTEPAPDDDCEGGLSKDDQSQIDLEMLDDILLDSDKCLSPCDEQTYDTYLTSINGIGEPDIFSNY